VAAETISSPSFIVYLSGVLNIASVMPCCPEITGVSAAVYAIFAGSWDGCEVLLICAGLII